MLEQLDNTLDEQIDKLKDELTSIMIGKGVLYYELLDGARYTVDGREAVQLGVVDEVLNLFTTLIEQSNNRARIDELKKLAEWKISDTGNNDYDILFARHKRSYDDRLEELQTILNKGGKEE